MTKNIFATCAVAVLLLVSTTRCSEDQIIADNEMQQAAAAQDRDSDNARTKDQKSIATPITGTIDGIAFTGNYRISKFVVEGDVLYAVGTLTDISGNGLPTRVKNLANKEVRMPVQLPEQTASSDAGRVAAAASCDILFLQLGPLDLDLLGLVIHLDQVTLNIDGTTGSGDLLGNLLCAITGLLDGVGTLVAIADLLNQVIDLIGTVTG
jgi:hypothetical protein